MRYTSYYEGNAKLKRNHHMDEPTEKDQAATPVTQDAGGDSSPSENIEVRTSNGGSQPEPAQVEPAASAPEHSEPPKPPQVTTSSGGGKKRGFKTLIIIVILLLVAGGGWYAYHKHKDNSKPKATAQSKDIPLLKIGVVSADFGKLYPSIDSSEYSLFTNAQMFEGLVRYEDQNKIVPDLASTWTNPDSKTWLFTLKSGIKFHDGHTMTANDVKYSINQVIANNPDFAGTFTDTIASVDVVNDNQVKITTTQPDPVLLNKLAFLYVIDANLPKGDEPSQAGTGPYEIKPGTTPTSSSVQMVAFNGYHEGVPTTKALDVGTEPDSSSMVKAFNAGKYNIVGTISPGDIAKAKKGTTEFNSSDPDVAYIGFNTVKPGPLQNKLVREAIRYAVNPRAIGDANGQQAEPFNQLIPQAIPGYNPSIPQYKQNIAKAKQLLAQAGYPNGLTLRLSTASDPREGTEIANELKQAGITLTIDQHNDFDEFISYFSSGQADMYQVDYSSNTLDGLDVLTQTLSDSYYNNPKFTALLNQATTETDPARRLKSLQEASAIADQDIATVPLFTENNIWLMDKPYAIKQDLPNSLISVYFYTVHLK